MFKVFDGMLGDATYLLTTAIVVVAIWFVIATWVRTKALAPTLGALILGAVVIFGVTNFDTGLKNRVQEDVDRYSEREDPPSNPRGGQP